MVLWVKDIGDVKVRGPGWSERKLGFCVRVCARVCEALIAPPSALLNLLLRLPHRRYLQSSHRHRFVCLLNKST